MPDKTSKPKIKTEVVEEEEGVEFEDSKPETETTEKETTDIPQVTEKSSETQPPKVASFSQLDTPSEKSDASPSIPQPERRLSDNEPLSSTTDETPESSEIEEKPKKEVSSDEVKKWLEEVRPDTSKEVAKSGGPNFKIILVILLFLAILGAIVGGVIYYRKGVTTPQIPTQVSKEEELSPTPSEEPEKVDLSVVSISVLNGSGVKGEAAIVKDSLVKAGFSEDKVETGNADKSDYKTTSLSTKKDIPESVFESLKKTLEGNYTVEKSETMLDEDSSFDFIVIVGARN